jgi:hypothetical protein
MDNLTLAQLSALLTAVFAPGPDERWLTLMVDLPDERVPDSDDWRDRRKIADEWFAALHEGRAALPFSDIRLCVYDNAGSNNNDLPETVTVFDDPTKRDPTNRDPTNRDPTARDPAERVGLAERGGGGGGAPMALDAVLDASSVVIAMTELSATAPLKVLARAHDFRGATMPGFSRAMIPALALDYERVDARVREFKERMDRATGIDVVLVADGRAHRCHFDLRFRTGHASGGLMRESGVVGNLPSGEAYIVPYEGEGAGEGAGEPSRTAGELPVQFGDEVVVYRIEGNRAVEVVGGGPRAADERARLEAEPAYGNMAEVGIGVLGQWGVEAVGTTLLDEKLGLHIAFGRSDHFGGVTGPASFRRPENVVHIDRVYVPSVQPRVRVARADFVYGSSEREVIIRDDAYVV